jgi:hypothetical protein
MPRHFGPSKTSIVDGRICPYFVVRCGRGIFGVSPITRHLMLLHIIEYFLFTAEKFIGIQKISNDTCSFQITCFRGWGIFDIGAMGPSLKYSYTQASQLQHHLTPPSPARHLYSFLPDVFSRFPPPIDCVRIGLSGVP